MFVGRRRYTDEERATAVLFLESEGYFKGESGALSRVSSRLGIPAATLSRWARNKQNPPPSELVNEKRRDLVALLQDELYAILKDMDSTRQDADYRTLGTVLGIVVDKLQLLGGGPTQRVESTVNIDDKREDILSKLAGIATATGTGAVCSESDEDGA